MEKEADFIQNYEFYAQNHLILGGSFVDLDEDCDDPESVALRDFIGFFRLPQKWCEKISREKGGL